MVAAFVSGLLDYKGDIIWSQDEEGGTHMFERGSHSDYHAFTSTSGSGSGGSSGGSGKGSLWFSIVVFILFVLTEISKLS